MPSVIESAAEANFRPGSVVLIQKESSGRPRIGWEKDVTYTKNRIASGMALVGLLVAAWLAPVGLLPAAASETAEATPAVRSTHDAALEARQLSLKGIDLIFLGRLDAGAERIRKARKLAKDDPFVRRAAAVVEAHMEYLKPFRQGRKEEFQRAGDRVEAALAARTYFKAHEDFLKAIRQHVKALGDAYEDVASSEDLLEEATDEGAAERKKTSLAALDESLQATAKMAETAAGAKGDGEYPKRLNKALAGLTSQLKAYRASWAEADVGDAKSRVLAARELKAREFELSEALTDMDALTARRPWRSALAHAQIARRIAEDRAELTAADWYPRVVAAANEEAQSAIDEGHWYDALAAYTGLADIESTEDTYRKRVKSVERRVRVARLYGDEEDLNGSDIDDEADPNDGQAEPDESAGDEDPEEALWKKQAEGVDLDMVRQAVARMSRFYVEEVDYRRAAFAGLSALKVLAELPGAQKQFDGLADAEQRKDFIDALDRQTALLVRKERIDQMTLELLLATTIRASQRTVQIPPRVVAMEFAEGALAELDKFTTIVWPHDVQNFEKSVTGKFYGVGIQITKEIGEPLKVSTPLADSPAYRAGIKAGDLIVAVKPDPDAEWTRTERKNLNELVRMITGKKGTVVKLRIERPGSVKPVEYDIVREEIHIRTVKGWKRELGGDGGKWDYVVDPDGKIAYVRITQFYGDTHEHLVSVLQDLKKLGVESLVLDLRFNPGGLLDSAQKVSDEFLRSGEIVSTRGRQTSSRAFRAHPVGNWLEGDVVVLVNDLSASAAEIVSGALGDLDRATIVGERSYGKGSVQNVFRLRPHQAYLKLTTAYYYLPSGRCLHRKEDSETWGVEPDVHVGLTPRQRKWWLDIRHRTDMLKEQDLSNLQWELDQQYESDVQLRTAVMLLKLKHLRDSATTVAEASTPAGAATR